jgi:hypothetical protein
MGKQTRARHEAGQGSADFLVPESLRVRLSTWIDVNEVGQAGFWVWLETVLPVLPPPVERLAEPSAPVASAPTRVRQLARGLVDCGRDRARLTIMCDRYFRDNQVLAVRLKSVEAALETTRATGRSIEVTDDPETAATAERYLPQR